MEKSFKSNYMYNLFYEVLGLFIPLVTTPYVSRVLGATAIGDYNYTVGIVTYFGLIALTGTATYGNREIAVYQRDRKKRSIVFWEVFYFRIISTTIALCTYFFFISRFLPEYRLLFIIQLFTVFSWVADISWFFQGMENFKVTALRNSFIKFIGTIMVFIFVKSPTDLWIYTMIYSATFLMGNLTMWVYLKKEVDRIPFKMLNIFTHTKNILQLFVPVIAIQIYTVMDKTMLGSMVNTTEVGYYSQADKIIKLAITIISSFIAILFPRISALYSQKNDEKLSEFIDKALDFIFLLSLPMMVGCILVIDEFVPFFFGEGYAPVTQIIQVLSWLFIILSLGRLLGTMLVATNQQANYTMAVIVAAVMNLVLNLVFIIVFDMGALGVSIASVISELTASIIQIYYVRNMIHPNNVFKSVKKYILPTVYMSVSIISLRLIFGTALLSLIIQIIIGTFTYFAILLYKRDKLVFPIFIQILEKFKITI